MAVNLSPVGGVAAQFFTNTGAVLTGGKLYTYAAGTTTPQATFTSGAGTTAWTNPIVLDAAGRVSGSGEIWLTDGASYKFVLKDSNDVLIATYDNITGINSNFINFTAEQEIQTATANQTVFTLTTTQYQPNTNTLSVFVDGVNQYGPGAQYAYIETSSTVVTFVSGLHVGASVKFTTTQTLSGGALDSSQVIYDPPFANSVVTTVENKLAQTVSVEDFGAVGNGVTNDTTAIQNAIDSLGAAGGIVLIPNGMKCVLDGNLTVKSNVSLVGPHTIVGSPQNNTSAPYGSLGGALLLDSSRTITLNGGASLQGLLIYRKGMTFPAANSSAFVGTAITIGQDDAAVFQCMILGFAQAISTNGAQRPRIYDTNIDCLAGVLINDCADIAYLNNIHCWPFATIAAGGAASSLHRSGSAFLFTNLGDWTKVTNCFSYGYYRGFYVQGPNSMTFVSCGADNTGSHSGSIGFLNESSAGVGGEDTSYTECQAAAQDTGYYINANAALSTRMVGCDTWGCLVHGFLIVSGDVNINGGLVRDVPNGITINSATSQVYIDNVRFDGISSLPINSVVANSSTYIGPANDFVGFAAGTVITNNTYNVIQSVASADPLNLPVNGNFFQITGTTGFGTVNGGWKGRQVVLKFTGVLLVSDGGASLKIAGNFTTAANSTLTLIYDGVAWCEVARSSN
jgi:hypothetical protein